MPCNKTKQNKSHSCFLCSLVGIFKWFYSIRKWGYWWLCLFFLLPYCRVEEGEANNIWPLLKWKFTLTKKKKIKTMLLFECKVIENAWLQTGRVELLETWSTSLLLLDFSPKWKISQPPSLSPSLSPPPSLSLPLFSLSDFIKGFSFTTTWRKEKKFFMDHFCWRMNTSDRYTALNTVLSPGLC